jgi:hypothetical protein
MINMASNALVQRAFNGINDLPMVTNYEAEPENICMLQTYMPSKNQPHITAQQ